MSPTVDDPDAERVQRCINGEPGAFRELFECYARRVYGTATRITGSPHDAEDILQEVFLKVHRRLHTFAFRSTFSLWIHKIAVHESLNTKRRRPTAPPAALPAPALPPDQEETMERLRSLTRPQRAVIVLRHLNGFSYEEIAELLEVPVGTVRSRLHEAHDRLGEWEAP